MYNFDVIEKNNREGSVVGFEIFFISLFNLDNLILFNLEVGLIYYGDL